MPCLPGEGPSIRLRLRSPTEKEARHTAWHAVPSPGPSFRVTEPKITIRLHRLGRESRYNPLTQSSHEVEGEFMRARKIDVNGVGIQVEDHGGDGPPIILLHHGGANLRVWDSVIPYLRDTCRCIALDLRAHGRSDAPQAGYHIDDMADDVSGVMDGLGAGRAHVVGSSIGAEVGLSLAANQPARVLSLVAEGALSSEYGPYGVREATSLADDEAMLKQLREGAERPEKVYESVEALVDSVRSLYQKHEIWHPAMETVLAYGVVETPDGQAVDAWRKWARVAYMENYFNLRVEDYYRRVTCPVLMLPGEQEAQDEQQFEIMTRLSKLPEQCEIVVVPGAVHPFGWMLIPERMAAAVLGFLRKIEN